ncbi:hypothetical protein L195_g051043 [Trifolium pratense]|uniref:Uncharacterized protein n=1 Tax=Trifolium pratense TaxID=57577 RepID=A0A2K3JXG4_TRIPR|nr:hypothetical protein L195_g051043 [Trifolium pratense]
MSVGVFCTLQGGRHSGYTGFEALVEQTQFEVESFTSGTKRRRSTLTRGYLIGDREESGIVAPKWCDYGVLVLCFNCG